MARPAGPDRVPTFDIRLDGRPLPPATASDVLRVVYRDDLDQIDGFLIELDNWDPKTMTTVYSDRADFLPGRKLDIAMGYLGSTAPTPMISGSITASRAVFSADEAQTLTVVGRGRLAALLGGPVTQTYENQTETQIVGAVAQRLGVTIQTGGSGALETPQTYVLQGDCPDILFLRSRARRLGYVLETTESQGEFGLYFGPPRTSAAVQDFVLGKDLTRFAALLDAGSQAAKLTVRSWDGLQKQAIVATAARGEQLGGGLAALDGRIRAAWSDIEETVVDYGAVDAASASALAQGLMSDLLNQLLVGEGESVGAPALRAGASIGLTGVGETYSGRWTLTSTCHVLDRTGYRTRFKCRRDLAS